MYDTRLVKLAAKAVSQKKYADEPAKSPLQSFQSFLSNVYRGIGENALAPVSVPRQGMTTVGANMAAAARPAARLAPALSRLPRMNSFAAPSPPKATLLPPASAAPASVTPAKPFVPLQQLPAGILPVFNRPLPEDRAYLPRRQFPNSFDVAPRDVARALPGYFSSVPPGIDLSESIYYPNAFRRNVR